MKAQYDIPHAGAACYQHAPRYTGIGDERKRMMPEMIFESSAAAEREAEKRNQRDGR